MLKPANFLIFLAVTAILTTGILVSSFSPSPDVLGTQAPTPSLAKLAGGIVPHHELAFAFTRDLWQRASQESYKQILIIGPSHYPIPVPVITTSNFPVVTDRIWPDDERLLADHAYTSQLQFAREYFPHLPVTGVLISSDIGVDKLRDLKTILAQNYSFDETLIVGSVDFSHYLTLKEMYQRDQEMSEYLASAKRSQKVIGLDDSYTDSWATLFLLFELAHENKLAVQLADYANAAEILNDFNLSTATSYFYLRFYH